jgi:hypothetical protein
MPKHLAFLKYVLSLITLLVIAIIAYSVWVPGRDIRDGRHDLSRNGIWLQHGWIGDDLWFVHNNKEDKKAYFRDPENIRNLAALLHRHHITDVYPHLCPTSRSGAISSVDLKQTELFLDIFKDFRVMPWVGGVLDAQVFLSSPSWRHNFAQSIRELFIVHPRLGGIHLNIEPCPSGNKEFLLLLEEVRNSIPKGRILSVAAYPPPTIIHPFSEVHWDKAYFGLVAQRADQIAVMMYDTAIRQQKIYQYLMAFWTKEILDWGNSAHILLGVPTYQDLGVGYHDPGVENLENALFGIHAGLLKYKALPANYQGIALYCEWEMDSKKWENLRNHFLKSQD